MRASLFFSACLLAGCGAKAVENESSPDASVDASPSPDASTPDAMIDSTTSIPDAGPPPPVVDGCVDIVLSTYDQSCQKSSDCIWVTAGEVCTGGCACGGALINVSEEGRYNQATAGIQSEGCPCPPPGEPVCAHGTCSSCMPGLCPDGD